LAAAEAEEGADKNEASLSAGKKINFKDSLRKIREYLFIKYPRQKFAIGSFLIIIFLGVVSVRALATSDCLIAWAPDNTTFYFHLKKEGADLIWQKIKHIKPFEDSELALSELVPPETKEVSIIMVENHSAILFSGNEATKIDEYLELKKLEADTYLISQPGFPALEKNSIITVTKQHGLGHESLSADGYLFIDYYEGSAYLPGQIKSWQAKLDSTASAWSIYVKDDAVHWESMTPKKTNGSVSLQNLFIPQNTSYWTHGDNWQKAWQDSLTSLPSDPKVIKIAGQSLREEMDNLGTPEGAFAPLFSGPYDIFINSSSDQKFWTLALGKTTNENPLWLNNFEKFWQKNVQATIPVYTTIILPDGTRAVEITAGEALEWQSQDINKKTIRWLKGLDGEFIIGYLKTENMLIMSNYYANLVDFLYTEDRRGWVDLAKISKKCKTSPDNLYSYHKNDENFTKLSEIISIIGPFVTLTNNNICHF